METPLIIRQTGTTNAGTAVDLAAPIVPPGQMWELRGVAIDNESGESVTAAFGVIVMGEFIRIAAQQTVGDGDCFAGTAWMLIREGERLAVRVTGTADKGKVTLIASGRIFQPDPAAWETPNASA